MTSCDRPPAPAAEPAAIDSADKVSDRCSGRTAGHLWSQRRRMSIWLLRAGFVLGAFWGIVVGVLRNLETAPSAVTAGAATAGQSFDIVSVGLHCVAYALVGGVLAAFPAATAAFFEMRKTVEESRRRTRASFAAATDQLGRQAAGCRPASSLVGERLP